MSRKGGRQLRLPSTHPVSPQAEQSRYLPGLIAAALCMVAVAAVIANISALPYGSESSFNLFLSQISYFLLPSCVALWFIALVLLLFQRNKKARVPGKNTKGASNASMLGILVFLSILVIFAAINNPGDRTGQDGQGTPDGGGQTDGAQGSQPGFSPPGPVSFIPLVAILALVFILSLRHIKTRRSLAAAEAPQSDSERKVLEQTIENLSKGTDVRSGILRTYGKMCRMVYDPEVEGPMTPRELEQLVIRQLGWPKRPVHELTGIFEEARYSDHALDEGDRALALDSLNELKAALEERTNVH